MYQPPPLKYPTPYGPNARPQESFRRGSFEMGKSFCLRATGDSFLHAVAGWQVYDVSEFADEHPDSGP